MSLIEKEALLALIEAEFEREDKTATEYARKGAGYDEYHAKYTHGTFCYLQAKKLIEQAPAVDDDDGKNLRRAAEITVSLMIDVICEQRKINGLDPVWLPPLSWCKEKFHYALESFRDGCGLSNNDDADVNPWAEAEKWHAEYHKIKNELVREKAYQRESAKLADKYFVELKKLPCEIFSELRSCVDYIEEQLPEGELPSAFVSLKEDIAALEKKYGVSEN